MQEVEVRGGQYLRVDVASEGSEVEHEGAEGIKESVTALGTQPTAHAQPVRVGPERCSSVGVGPSYQLTN